MALGKLLILLLFLIFIVPAWSQDSEATGAVGGVTFLNPNISSQNPIKYSQIHWRWKNQVRIANRIWGQEPTYTQSRFSGRLELLDNHTLKMSHLELGDSGEYRLYLEDEQGRESVHSVLLKVYDIVPKPRVSATTNGDPRHCDATLNCSVSLPEVAYEWIPPQKLQAEVGPVLRVTPDPNGGTYMCRVSNPVSSSNASLTFRHPCTWTGETSSVTCATPSALLALGGFILLFLLLAMA